MSDARHRLTIGRHQATYLIAGNSAEAGLQQRLDGVMARDLPAAVAAALEPHLPADDPSVWLIRRLALEASLPAGEAAEARDLAQAWGRRAGTAVRQALAGGSDGENVISFPNRAAYVAQFIADLLAGRAWGRWYYRPFAGLRSLPTAAAVRRALLDAGVQAGDILLLLAGRGRLAQTLEQLRPEDAGRVLAACLAGTRGGPDLGTAVRQLLAVWPAAGVRPQPAWTGGHNQLRLWLAWRRAHGDAPAGRDLLAAAERLLELAGLLEALPDRAPLLQALAAGDLARALEAARGAPFRVEAAGLAVWRDLGAGRPEWLAEVAATLAPEPAGRPARQMQRPVISAHGGLFLLLPGVIDLRLHEILAGPTPATSALWLAWLLLKCLGRPRLDEARRDPLIWAAVGLDGPPESSAWDAAVAGATPAVRAGWRHGLATLLGDQGRLDGRFVVVEAIAANYYAKGSWVARDPRGDYWLQAAPGPPDPAAPAALLPGVQSWQPDQGATPDDPILAAFRRQAKPAAILLHYLALAPALPAPLDLDLAPAAAAVLRTFARRLLGFGWSGFDYLFANFLAGESQVLFTPQEIQVTLPPAPLHAMLRLAGFNEHHYTIPWLDDRPVRLRLSEEG